MDDNCERAQRHRYPLDYPKVLVLTHGHCPDGFTAAWVMWRMFGKDADIRFMRHDDDPPTPREVDDKLVVFTDFCFNSFEAMDAIRDRARKLVVLDHHKTAGPILDKLCGDLPASLSHHISPIEGDREHCNSDLLRMDLRSERLDILFDNEKCGARLAWEYLNPDQPAPPIIDYVEDRDLWRWKLANSREVNSSLSSYDFDFNQWSVLAETDVEALAADGRAIERYKKREIRAICQNAREVTIAGHKVLAVNSCTLISDVAGEVSKGRAFGAAWFLRGDGKTQVSLRVRDDGDFDVSGIAASFGGGGHKKAAGFVTDKQIDQLG